MITTIVLSKSRNETITVDTKDIHFVIAKGYGSGAMIIKGIQNHFIIEEQDSLVKLMKDMESGQ